MACACLDNVDLDLLYGVYIRGWLNWARNESAEELHFCAACSPDAQVQSGLSGKACKSEENVLNKASQKIKGLLRIDRKKSKLLGSSKNGTGSAFSTGDVLGASAKDLFLCITCGSCYCDDHVRDHYSSRCPSDNLAPIMDAELIQGPRVLHSYFVAVPTHSRVREAGFAGDTGTGTLFRPVFVPEIEDGSLSLNGRYTFSSDYLLSASALPKQVDAKFVDTKQANGSTNTEVVTVPPHISTAAMEGPHAGSLCLPPPYYPADTSNSWRYVFWCIQCESKPTPFDAHTYDESVLRHRKLRRIGDAMTVLCYLRLRGVQLTLPKCCSDVPFIRQVTPNTSSRRSPTLSTIESETRKMAGIITTADGAVTSSGPTCALRFSRTETDVLMQKAKIAGFENFSFFCYLNSVLQCVINCHFFTEHLLQVEQQAIPGPLTATVCRVLHHLQNETCSDVRNGTVHPLVGDVYKQIIRLSSMFEADEQQDAQELMLCLLNGIADEFDKGKSAEEKKAMKRISFEGVMRMEVECQGCHTRIPREEMFMAISIPAAGSIDEGLKSLFSPAYLKGKDRYACERCFKNLSRAEREAHNEAVRVRKEEEKAKKAMKTEKQTSTNVPTEKPCDKQTEDPPMGPDCLYQEAVMTSQITQLGGTLAVHVLRFRYSPEQQSFIKVVAPVRIPLQLDVAQYVSAEVLRTYATEQNLSILKAQFPTVEQAVLVQYLSKSNNNPQVAGMKLQRANFPRVQSQEQRFDANCNIKTPTELVPVTLPTLRRCMSSPHGDASKFATGSEASVTAGAVPDTVSSASNVFVHSRTTSLSKSRNNKASSLLRNLVGIVAHRGNLSGGHYVAYVRRMSHPDLWFRCDDEVVDIVDEKTVLDCAAEVYLAFYE